MAKEYKLYAQSYYFYLNLFCTIFALLKKINQTVMTNDNNYCVIMAGGVGSRFWPLSKTKCPKQFLDILGTGKSFIRSTFERFLPLIPAENFLVVTSDIYRDLVLEHLPELRADQVLCEPVRRNTAPCIAYASYRIKAMNPKANIIVTPSDHLILNEVEFRNIVSQGIEFVSKSTNLLTIGIKPSRPETGYGYIQVDTQGHSGMKSICKVRTFTEKPNLEMAKVFMDSGEFFWNSGIFIWSVTGIVQALNRYLPEVSEHFASGQDVYGTPAEQAFIDELYPRCENISIDYGVMEKADNVYVRCGDFGWSDIGTWGSLYQHATKDCEGNAVTSGDVLTYNTKNSIISLPAGRVAVVEGLDGYLVAEKDGTLLICKLEGEQNIRNYVEDVRYKFSEDYV